VLTEWRRREAGEAEVTTAVLEAERAATAAAARLWASFGLRSAPPRWTPFERAGAAALLGHTILPLDQDRAQRTRERLLAIAAERWSQLLVAELGAAGEEPLRRALAERYDSVRARYAPRTRFHTRGLCSLLSTDGATAQAMRRQLVRWQLSGFNLEEIPGRLEAAFVQARSPIRLA
jgi:hypothetical protein